MRVVNVNNNVVLAGPAFSMQDMTHLSDTVWIPKDGSDDRVMLKKAVFDSSKPVTTVRVVYEYLGNRIKGKRVFVKDYLSFQTRFCLLIRANTN